MKYNPQIPGRRSIRLKGYDYTQPGAYFITVCTHNRECLLGEVLDGEMILNHLGEIVLQVWHRLPTHYPYIELDAFCVMPNHFHGIIFLTDPITDVKAGSVGAGSVGAGLRPAPTTNRPNPTTNQPTPDQPTPSRSSHNKHGLPEIVRALKSFSARFINQHLDRQGIPVWQRNYYEHIIRHPDELNKIRRYIIYNTRNWESDHNNPTTSDSIDQPD